MESSTRVPRASIAVSILRDPEYLDLVGQPGGFAAFGIFVALVTLAREQNHGGDLSAHHIKVVASMIGASQEQLENALNLLELTCAEAGNPKGLWLIRVGKSLKIRQYRKWNQSGWGGVRSGSGRQSGNQDNQDGIKTESSCADSDSDSDSDSSSSSSSKTHQKVKRQPSSKRNRFDAWWSCYPRKVGKKTASKAYDRARKDVGHDALLDAVTEYAAAVAKWPAADKPRLIPHPTTWLNGGRWADDRSEWIHTERKHEQRKFRA